MTKNCLRALVFTLLLLGVDERGHPEPSLAEALVVREGVAEVPDAGDHDAPVLREPELPAEHFERFIGQAFSYLGGAGGVEADTASGAVSADRAAFLRVFWQQRLRLVLGDRR